MENPCKFHELAVNKLKLLKSKIKFKQQWFAGIEIKRRQ